MNNLASALQNVIRRSLIPKLRIVTQQQPQPCRLYSSTNENEEKSDGERHIENILRSNLDVEEVTVSDISGGCGSMYEVYVSSNIFKGKRTVQQHRLITQVLKDEVKQMHGLRIHTSIPSEANE